MMEQISLGQRYKECRPRKNSSCQTKILVGKDVLKELEQRRSSPSVIAKLMGIDVLPPACVAHTRQQEFKDVFEVSEEPPEVVTKERSHHFPKGLPSLKRSALKLKKLIPSKSLYGVETFENEVEYRNGLDRLNSLEINNPLFENRHHDVNYSPNHQHEKDTFRKYPVGLANSSLRDIKNSLRGKIEDFNSIVVLEPGLGNDHDPENPSSMPFLSHMNKKCRRDRKQKQAEFAVMNNERVSPHILDPEDVNVARIKRERYLGSNEINPLLNGQEPSFDQFNMTDMNYTGSSRRYGSGDGISKRNKKLSSNSLSRKIFQKYEEADVGSRTLAEMFALSDSERVKRNSDSHAQVRHNKLDGGKGHSKEGCFIVLPKHASPFTLRSSLKGSSCEGSQYSENCSIPSSSYMNDKFHTDSSRDKPRLQQIGSVNRNYLSNASGVKHLNLEQRRPASPSHDDSICHAWRLVDDFVTSDCTSEKVLFTTDEDLVVQKPTGTVRSSFGLQLSGEQKVSALPFQCRKYKSKTMSNQTDAAKCRIGLEEIDQPSPVSILEPPTDEDSSCSEYFKYDFQDIPNVESRINHCQLQDEPEAFMTSDDDNDSSYQSLEAFQVEEDRDFSYLLDILICSSMIVADWQLLCKSWHSPAFPVSPHVFDRLERKYSKVVTWSKSERRLLFDLANSVLSDVLAPCTDVHPWVTSRRHCRPIWGPEGPVEKVWQMMVRKQEELAIGHPDDKVLDPNWLEVGDDINMVGKQIARMLHGDLLEEIVLEFL